MTLCSATRRSHSPASNRACTTVVLPEYKLAKSPSEPPTWKNGTHIKLTIGGVSARKGAAKPVILVVSTAWVIGTALGSPVVPLVKRTSASLAVSSSGGGSP